jgi:hypothetical protein
MFVFLYNIRYVIASLLILVALLFLLCVFWDRPKSSIIFASEFILRWAFIPLVFFIVNFLNNVVLLLQEHSNEWFIITFYILGLVILTIVFLRLLIKAVSTRWQSKSSSCLSLQRKKAVKTLSISLYERERSYLQTELTPCYNRCSPTERGASPSLLFPPSPCRQARREGDQGDGLVRAGIRGWTTPAGLQPSREWHLRELDFSLSFIVQLKAFKGH